MKPGRQRDGPGQTSPVCFLEVTGKKWSAILLQAHLTLALDHLAPGPASALPHLGSAVPVVPRPSALRGAGCAHDLPVTSGSRVPAGQPASCACPFSDPAVSYPRPWHCTSVQGGSMLARERGSSPPLVTTALQFTTLLPPAVCTAGTSMLPSLWRTSPLPWDRCHLPSDTRVLPPSNPSPQHPLSSEEQSLSQAASDSVSTDPVSSSPLCYSRMFLSRFPVTVSYPTRGPIAVLIFGVQQ